MRNDWKPSVKSIEGNIRILMQDLNGQNTILGLHATRDRFNGPDLLLTSVAIISIHHNI